MSLENLKEKLYSQETKMKKLVESHDATQQPEYEKTFLGANWEEENAKETKERLKTKKIPEKPAISEKQGVNLNIIKWAAATAIFLIFSGIVLAGFYFYSNISANQEIIFSVSAPLNILTGVPFNLKFNVSNNSKNALKNAEISIFLPENSVAIENEKEKRIFTKTIGNLESNAILNGEIPLVIFGNNETVKKFDISLNYTAGQNSKFEKKQNIEIIAKETAIKLDLTAPEKIINNEFFEISAKYLNISEYNFKKIRINFEYPKNFSLKKIEPLFQNGYLEIELPKNKEEKILISGSATGQEQSFLEIKLKIETLYNGIWRQINEQSVKLNFAPSPLSLKIESNVFNYAFPDDSLTYQLIYYNNSDIALNDAVIKTKLNGEMFDFLTLQTDGTYDSRNNIISWNASNIPKLKSINQKSGDSVQFSIKLKPNYPIRKISDKNFTVSIDAEISSPTVPYHVITDKTVGLAKLETKIGGNLTIKPLVYFREPKFEIANSGTLPPKANLPINFTIHWLIKNYSTDIKNATIKAYLAPGVIFTGISKSNIESTPVYNERNGEIVWTINKIPATKGIVSAPIETVFQIKTTPNIIMIGQGLPLINEITISAIDEFTNQELKDSIRDLTTLNLNDWGFDYRNGIVIQ